MKKKKASRKKRVFDKKFSKPEDLPQINKLLLEELIKAKKRGDNLTAFGYLAAILLLNAENREDFRKREKILETILTGGEKNE